MLTRDEQEQIFAKVKAFACLHVTTARKVKRDEITRNKAAELLEEAEEEIRDFLKEVG